MAGWDKKLGRMRQNSQGWRYGQVANILSKFGFEPPTDPKGSHRVWRHPSGRKVGLVDAGRGKIKPVYVKAAIAAIDEVIQADHDGGDV